MDIIIGNRLDSLIIFILAIAF